MGAASIYHHRITVIVCSDSLDTANREPTQGPAVWSSAIYCIGANLDHTSSYTGTVTFHIDTRVGVIVSWIVGDQTAVKDHCGLHAVDQPGILAIGPAARTQISGWQLTQMII